MYGVKVYITPDDILNRLSDRDRERFNKCVFTDVAKDTHNGIEISCLLFDDKTITKEECRYRLDGYNENKIELKYQNARSMAEKENI